MYSFNATDDDEFTVQTMDGVPDNGNLNQMGSELNFTFTIPFASQNLADFSLGFSAQDSEGAVSSLQPQLRICACVNGNCTIEGIADTGANTIVLNCECPEGQYISLQHTVTQITTKQKYTRPVELKQLLCMENKA